MNLISFFSGQDELFYNYTYSTNVRQPYRCYDVIVFEADKTVYNPIHELESNKYSHIGQICCFESEAIVYPIRISRIRFFGGQY